MQFSCSFVIRRQKIGCFSAGFTLDTYAHVTTNMQQDAADKVGNFLKDSM